MLTKRAAAFALLLAFTISSFACADEIREHEFNANDLDTLRMDVNVGSITIKEGNSDRIKIHLVLDNDGDDSWFSFSSDSNLDASTDIESDVRGSSLYIRFKEEDIKSTWEIEVPRHFSTEIDMAVGAVEIAGLQGDQEVDLAVGSVSIEQEESTIAEIELKSNVGDTDVSGMRSDSNRTALIGSSTSAYGEGRSYIEVTVNVGEANVRATSTR